LAGPGSPPQTRHAMAAAVLSGTVIGALVTPIELVKSRLQVVPQKRRQAPVAMVRAIMAQQGIRGLYQGLSAVTFCRQSNWAYFGGYSAAQEFLSRFSDSRVVNAVLAGGCAGLCYWSVAIPFDTLKARMMMEGAPKGFVHNARLLYTSDGLKGFARGFAPTALRAFPANAAAFTCFEATAKALGL
jgi:hypothetical protein